MGGKGVYTKLVLIGCHLASGFFDLSRRRLAGGKSRADNAGRAEKTPPVDDRLEQVWYYFSFNASFTASKKSSRYLFKNTICSFGSTLTASESKA